jgi:hypothetical protein
LARSHHNHPLLFCGFDASRYALEKPGAFLTPSEGPKTLFWGLLKASGRRQVFGGNKIIFGGNQYFSKFDSEYIFELP